MDADIFWRGLPIRRELIRILSRSGTFGSKVAQVLKHPAKVSDSQKSRLQSSLTVNQVELRVRVPDVREGHRPGCCHDVLWLNAGSSMDRMVVSHPPHDLGHRILIQNAVIDLSSSSVCDALRFLPYCDRLIG